MTRSSPQAAAEAQKLLEHLRRYAPPGIIVGEVSMLLNSHIMPFNGPASVDGAIYVRGSLKLSTDATAMSRHGMQTISGQLELIIKHLLSGLPDVIVTGVCTMGTWNDRLPRMPLQPQPKVEHQLFSVRAGLTCGPWSFPGIVQEVEKRNRRLNAINRLADQTESDVYSCDVTASTSAYQRIKEDAMLAMIGEPG